MSRARCQYSKPAGQTSGSHLSSAFSNSANPDEDWTKISDLAERRRIQNRIAQRNYRKKLKKRLEDLERRAGSSSESSPQPCVDLQEQVPQTELSIKHYMQSPEIMQQISLAHDQFSPSLMGDNRMFPGNFRQEDSRAHPVLELHPGQYPVPDEILYPSYHITQPPSRSFGTFSANENSCREFVTSLPVSQPPTMNMSRDDENIKLEENVVSPYDLNFQGLTESRDDRILPNYNTCNLNPHISAPVPAAHEYDHSLRF